MDRSSMKGTQDNVPSTEKSVGSNVPTGWSKFKESKRKSQKPARSPIENTKVDKQGEEPLTVCNFRILHTLGWVAQGGVERLRASIAEHSGDDRFEHYIICQIADEPLVGILTSHGWKVFEIGTARHILDFSWYRRAWKVSRGIRPHLIHGSVFEGCALAAFLGIVHPKAKVVLEEQSDGRARSWRGRLLLRSFSSIADKHIGVAPQIVQYLKKEVGVRAPKLMLLDNAVHSHPSPPPRKLASIKRDLGLVSEDFVLGSVGRLHDDHKRFSDLIRAIALLDPSFDHIKLLIVGGGEDEEMLRNLAKELGVHKKVVFTGFRPDVRNLLYVMDGFALVSAGEALPLALIEAMHSGVASIASDVGGNRYVLDDGRAGILVPPSDPVKLKESIQRLASETEFRQTLSKEGKQRAEDRFGLNQYLTSLTDLWSSLLNTPR